MHRSALQLEHYEFGGLQITPVEDFEGGSGSRYPSFSNAQLQSFVEFGEAARGEKLANSLWGIKLRLTCERKDGAAFPYTFDVSIVGFLNGAELPEENRQNLVLVNGTSLLYGALRDEVMRITARMRHGPLLLPTVQFSSLASTHGTDKVNAKEVESVPKKAEASPPKRRLKLGGAKP